MLSSFSFVNKSKLEVELLSYKVAKKGAQQDVRSCRGATVLKVKLPVDVVKESNFISVRPT